MDQLAEMRVFVRAIERGTFAGAAGDLGLTPSAVSMIEAVDNLETLHGPANKYGKANSTLTMKS